MPKTGSATLPLHYGRAPRWLFCRMTALAREIVYAIVSEQGNASFLEKISDPYWFQSLGCILGFDWHSSGLTTTLTGALKEAVRGREKELGIFFTGGKGSAARKTPEHIRKYADNNSFSPDLFIYASRMSAKVDNTAVQDGYQLYHHVFVFTNKGQWGVIQQGMNEQNRMARRYHWLGNPEKDFVDEPHSAVCCNHTSECMNLTDRESADSRLLCTELSRERPEKILKDLQKLNSLTLSPRHHIQYSDLNPKKIYRVLLSTYEHQPADFEQLLGIRGVGPKAIRALSLLSELIYGSPPSYRDPARFSFAHGGKDGTPFPVDRTTYDKTIEVMKRAVLSAKVGRQAKIETIQRLSQFFPW